MPNYSDAALTQAFRAAKAIAEANDRDTSELCAIEQTARELDAARVDGPAPRDLLDAEAKQRYDALEGKMVNGLAAAPSPAATLPERAGGGEAGIACSRCKGSGEGTVQIGAGPDAYDAPVMCEACGGSGAFDPADPLRPFPTMLRKMWSGGDVQRWIDENIAPAYAAMCKLAALNAPPAVAPEGEQQRDVLIECIAAAAVRAGIIRPDALVDGPTAMMLANDLATAALNAPPAADGMVVAVVREVCAEMKAELVANQGIRPNQVRGWHMRLSAAAPRQDGAEGVGK